ncbi:MAG: hypothetical protein HQ494_07020 [Rhodospirillales bacterium]|nr:hypothetical protein [Rhodospirillales bacterium]
MNDINNAFDTAHVPEPSEGPLSVLDLPAHLKKRYRRLVLVSSCEQAGRFDDGDTLLVTSDWLGWRRMVDAGGHALHFEAMLGTWPEERGDPHRNFLESSDWVYLDGRDITLFRGVSLGKQLNRHVSYMRNAYLRLWHALDRFCIRFLPEEIVVHGLRMESDVLDADIIENLVRDVAGRHDIVVHIGSQPTPRETGTYPISPFIRTSSLNPSKPIPSPKRWLREVYLNMVTQLFRLRFAFTVPKPRMFLFHNWLVMGNLLENFANGGVTPVFLAEPWPKTLSFVLKCLGKGILLTRLPTARLDAGDHAAIDAIIQRLDDAWATPAQGLEEARRTFIRRHLIESGWIRERALEAKRYERLFRDAHVARVVIGDSNNWVCSTVIETAQAQGIPSDELLNGMFLSAELTDNRCHDAAGRKPPLTRLLSWGEQNERWLSMIHSPLPYVRTGYPGLDGQMIKSGPPSEKRDNALILSIMPYGGDVAGLFAESFHLLITIARMLKKIGYQSLRFKIHPAHGSTKPYFESVLAYHGVDCLVVTEGPLSDQVEWANIVVGPVSSGGVVETLAEGKPYYPFHSLPSSLSPELFGGAQTYSSAAELGQALKRGDVPDRDTILQAICSTRDIPNASLCFWEVMEETLAPKERS